MNSRVSGPKALLDSTQSREDLADSRSEKGMPGPHGRSGPDASVAGPRLRVLLLCDYDDRSAGTIRDHIRGLVAHSRHRYVIRNGRGDLLAGVDLSAYDAVVVHYSLVACYDAYLAPATRRKIRAFRGLKAAFVQDDYRFINRTVEAFAYLGIHALFPLAGPGIIDAVYPETKLPGVRKTTVLAGYVPEHLAEMEVPSYAERPIDVGYRARKPPAWMGSHTLQKWQIAERFAADAERYGLRVDLSCREEDRIYGDDWIRFVTQCKAMLGTESGASVCDFTGEIQQKVERHLERDPEASFEELQELYFKHEDGRLLMNVISPRCFEAAALRTLMVMYEGEYSGVLEPWRHYVPLRRDHSNMEEVVRILRDAQAAQKIIDRAYRELILSGRYSYRAMVEKVDRILEECLAPEMLAANRLDSAANVGTLVAGPLPLNFNSPLPEVLSSPPRNSGAFRPAYGAFRELARRVTPAPLWELLRAAKRRTVGLRNVIVRFLAISPRDVAQVFSSPRSHKAGSIDTVALLDELARLRALLAFFSANPDTELLLELDRQLGEVRLVGLPTGASLDRGGRAEFVEYEARRALLEMGVKRISWSNHDTLGLGEAAPFERHFVFAQIGTLAKTRPDVLADLLLPEGGARPYRRIALSSSQTHT